MAPRKDLGAPIDGFFVKLPATTKPIALALRTVIEEAMPTATSSIKWGNAFFEIDGAMFCAIGAHKAHVNLILWGPPASFADPGDRLTGEGKTGRHLKLTSVAEIPRAAVKRWVRTAAANARSSKGRS
jgi:hypothetical protein